MGCSAREKHIRASRRARSSSASSAKPESDMDDAISKSIAESGLKPLKQQQGPNDSSKNPNPNPIPSPNPNADEAGWGYCTEEQLEEILLKNLEFVYNEAVSKLVALGYEEELALKAILRNGHCYGGMDVLTNILHNSLAYLNSYKGDRGGRGGGNSEESETVFSDLRQLQEYSLAGMVCLLQQVRPNLSKGDAMWCLLMSDLHVGKASTLEIPVPGNGPPDASAAAVPASTAATVTTSTAAAEVASTTTTPTVEGGSDSVGVMSPAHCKFHGGWGFGNGSGGSDFPASGFVSFGADMNSQLQRNIEFPKRFNLSPSMKDLLKRNVAAFAAGYRANSNQSQTLAKGSSGSSTTSAVDSLAISGTQAAVVQPGDLQDLDKQDGANSILRKLNDLSLDETLELVAEDQKDEVILTLLHQIKDLEKQVKEQKDWAHRKAVQAARKLTSDLTELKTLRMEREENQRLKKGKQALEDTTMKRLAEMENALRKASGQVDRANAAVRRLETENAEIKAEMEASKLSASESVTACLEVAKREKKVLKKLLAWEKQKAKLQKEISDEKDKIVEAEAALVQIKQSQKEAEAKWKEELKAKEEAIAQVEEEQRAKEAAESDNKRKIEALRVKIEIDFQRHKDDVQRLEQELTRLKAAQSAELQSNNSPASESGGARRDSIMKLLQELDNLEDFSEKEYSDRECIICMKDEVSIVFLPCAHQVMCASCSEEYGRKGKAACPCCRVPIQQRIRVFGASS